MNIAIIKEKEFVEQRMGMWEGLEEEKGGMMQSCFNEAFKKIKVFICILESIPFTRYLT